MPESNDSDSAKYPPSPQFPRLPFEVIRHIAISSNSLELACQNRLLCRLTRTLLSLADWSLILASNLYLYPVRGHPLAWFYPDESDTEHKWTALNEGVPPNVALGAAKRLLELGVDPTSVPQYHLWPELDWDRVGEYAIANGDVAVTRLCYQGHPPQYQGYHIYSSSILSGLAKLLKRVPDVLCAEEMINVSGAAGHHGGVRAGGGLGMLM
ncbi:hypothetical protein HDV00_008648, partial [Rhizophlyctis rosea]